jgi:hypothetical protein
MNAVSMRSPLQASTTASRVRSLRTKTLPSRETVVPNSSSRNRAEEVAKRAGTRDHVVQASGTGP